jgi:hypothetical protein
MLTAVKHLACLFGRILPQQAQADPLIKERKKNAGHKDKRLSKMIWHKSTP